MNPLVAQTRNPSQRIWTLATSVALLMALLACEPSNAPPQSPRPTPVPPAGLDLEYLDYSYPPSGMSGHSYVSRGSDGEIYMLNIQTGRTRQLTDDGVKKYSPVMSDRYVAWTEHHSPTKLAVRSPSSDIVVLDLESGARRRITDVPAQRSQLDMHGHRLVWTENRHTGGGSDIYAHDLESKEEIPIAVRPGYQGQPNIYGDIVVWTDNRDSPILGTPREGCSNCADNRRDIYLYDFTTGHERKVVSTGALNASPSVHGNNLVWLGYTTEPVSASVHLLDLETGVETEISKVDASHASLTLPFGRYVTWSITWPCDVISSDMPEDTGLYLYDIETGRTTKITDYVEPLALMDDGVVIVTERCFGISRLYAVFPK